MFLKMIFDSIISPNSGCTCTCECGTCGDSSGEANGRTKGAGGVATVNAQKSPSC